MGEPQAASSKEMRMRALTGTIAGLSLLAVLLPGCSRAGATASEQQAGGTRTVTGTVVCLVCYARNNANTGHDHDSGRVCAKACVKWEGNPVGLVAADGKVYQFTGGLVANNNAVAAEFVAQTVSVTGEVFEKDGMTMIRSNDAKVSQ
jgi:hypothetical protein